MLHLISVLPVGDAALCTAEEKSCRLSSPSIALTVAWMCFWVRFQGNARKSLFTCPGLVSVEKEEWRGVEVRRGELGSEEGGEVKCVLANFSGRPLGFSWLVVQRGCSVPLCCQTAPQTTVPRMCVWVFDCVCVCCCGSSILVRTNFSGPVGPWEWQRFWLVLTSFKVWLGVLVKVPLHSQACSAYCHF